MKHSLNPNSPAGDFSDANGDLNGDGYTNLEEYLNSLAAGGTQPPYSCSDSILADLNGDCQVNFTDFAEFAGAWMSGEAKGNLNGDADIDFEDAALFAADWLNCTRTPSSECWQ